MRYVWAVYRKGDYQNSIELYETEAKANERRNQQAKNAVAMGFVDGWLVEQLDLR